MSERLAAAEAALQAGRAAEAIDHMIAVIEADPAQSAQFYRMFVLQFYRTERYAEGETWAAKALERLPRDFDLWNLRGAILRRMGALDQAVSAFSAALRLTPNSVPALSNLANVHLDRGDGPAAEAILTKLVRLEPKKAEHQRMMGRALLRQGRTDAALARFRQALMLDKTSVNAWLDLSGMLIDLKRFAEAHEVLGRAHAAVPGAPKLLEAKAVVLRREGKVREAEAFLLGLLPAHEGEPWIHQQVGAVLADVDRPRANIHFHRAVEMGPTNPDYVFPLAESLQRSRHDDEAANIEESYHVIRKVLGQAALAPRHSKVASEILLRVGAFDERERLGGFSELGRSWAQAGIHAALMSHLARVRSPEDRRELIELHRTWARQAEVVAARRPVVHPPRDRTRAKLRIGFMSSDLRSHPVGSFAIPLFETYDRSRFEVYCYSFVHGEADRAQLHIQSLVDGFRWRPDITDHDAAQMIADDDLDMLIELGGSTHMNKLEVMAYKPARLQASWLGYAHSAGPSTIDYLILDPYMKPEDPGLLIETPLMLPHCWYSLAAGAYRADPAVEPVAPVER
ncbi:MAG: tetratricopeptide repeat protein, partial [Phenylobacterium sp.]